MHKAIALALYMILGGLAADAVGSIMHWEFWALLCCGIAIYVNGYLSGEA